MDGMEASAPELSLEEQLRDSDAQLGKALRRVKQLEDQEHKRDRWLWEAKQEAGYDSNVSFDRVWDDVLAASRRVPKLRDALQAAHKWVLASEDERSTGALRLVEETLREQV